MMIINDTRTKNNKVYFKDLPIGQVYEDADGVICIKISDGGTDDNCIIFVRGGWERADESATAMVTPLKTTLLIEKQ